MPYQKHTGAGGIETSNRVEDGFEAKTTSMNFALSAIYFMTAFILYELWIVTRIETIKCRKIILTVGLGSSE